MKKITIVSLISLVLSVNLMARNEILEYSFKEAMSDSKAKEVLDPNIALKFGKGHGGNIITKNIFSNRKTNNFNKADKEACFWAFYSTMKSFQSRTIKEGGTKAINLESYLDRKTINDKTKFQCRVGTFTAAVVIKGDIAK